MADWDRLTYADAAPWSRDQLEQAYPWLRPAPARPLRNIGLGHTLLTRVLPIAAGMATGGLALGALGGAGALASVPGAVGSSVAPLGVGSVVGSAAVPAATSAAVGAAGGAMTFGNLLRLGELGVGLGTSLVGQRAQTRALTQDSAQRAREFAAQMAMVQQQNDMARQQWEADQAQRAQEFGLAQEDRTRRIRLEDEREARMAPFRQARADALIRLRDLMTLGRR